MSKGDQSFLAPTIFGLIVTSAGLGAWAASDWAAQASSYPSYYESLTSQQNGEAAPLIMGLKIEQKRRPCSNIRSRDDSNLCAQWRAVKAAERAADYGWWQALVSFLGAIGLGATLAFNWVTIRMALKGQKDAERMLHASEMNALAARRANSTAAEANQISRETMQRQLRPYVYLFDQRVAFRHIHGFNALDDFADVEFTIQNFGQAPAKNVTFVAHAVIGEYWSDRSPDVTAEALKKEVVVPLGDIPPHHIRHRPGYSVTGLKEAYWNIQGGMRSIFLEGQIRYTDDFGNPYFTNFQLAMSGSKHEDEPPSATPHWNEAT